MGGRGKETVKKIYERVLDRFIISHEGSLIEQFFIINKLGRHTKSFFVSLGYSKGNNILFA